MPASAFGDDLPSKHLFVIIPSGSSTHSWDLWGDYTKVTFLHALMTAICVTRRVYAFAGLWASGEFGMAGVPRAPDRRRLITLSSAD